ncbi:hypothetical protein AB0N31_30590 [Streptomyces sp. NPDC051051]|uniref:hypothetical protein n=1 Tax=unclassified Streptomyces TaxID=2593676 RepID=UPI003444EF3D
MSSSLHKRAAAVLAATGLMMGAAVTAGASTASAAVPTGVEFRATDMQSDGSRSVLVIDNGRAVGAAHWHADGDYLEVVDTHADGFGVAGYLSTSPIREASTYGHSSPYTVTKGGNLTEDKRYKFWVCFGGSAGQLCSPQYNVTS